MTDQPVAVVTTAKRRFAVRRPSRTTLKKAATILAALGLGAFVGWRATDKACACPTDTDETVDQSTD